MLRWQIWHIPNLLGDESDAFGEFFERVQVRAMIAAGGKLVMTTLPGQQRPGAADAPTIKGRSVLALAVSVVVIAPPAWPQGCLHLEYGIDDSHRILDERIVRAANSIAN